MLYPKGSLAIINVPYSPAQQYVQNVQTGAWCRFTGIDATCWAIANNAIYYAKGHRSTSSTWAPTTPARMITYDLKTAFSSLRTPQQKRFTAIRPLMSTVSWLRPSLEVDVDYRDTVPTATAITVNISDLVAAPQYAWSACSGIGFVASARMRIMAVNVPQTYIATDSALTIQLMTGDGAGGNGLALITQDAVPNVPFQLTSFDLLFEPGGVF
jgi:hypothetical protein